jgi:hypothetical protein
MKILRTRPECPATGIYNAIVICAIFWLLMLFVIPAFATNKPKPPETPPQAESASISNAAAGSNSASESASESLSESISGANNAMSNRETHIGVSMGGVNTVQISECFVPKKKLGRGFRALFGAWEMTPVMELDAVCLAEKRRESDQAHERAMSELANERLRLEIELQRSMGK